MENVQLAEVAAVLAEPSRATMCLAMIDGRAWTVGELAKAADIAPSTASEHASKLVEAGFAEPVRQGRNHYLRISDPRVAELIERIAEHANLRPPRGLRSSLRTQRLAFARTCYDHLAGRLGVAVHDGMIGDGLIDTANGLHVTARGREVLEELGITLPTGSRRSPLRQCLDWTERRYHLSGSIPAAMLDRAVEAGWLERLPGRAVRAGAGADQPLARLGVDLGQVEKASSRDSNP